MRGLCGDGKLLFPECLTCIIPVVDAFQLNEPHRIIKRILVERDIFVS